MASARVHVDLLHHCRYLSPRVEQPNWTEVLRFL